MANPLSLEVKVQRIDDEFNLDINAVAAVLKAYILSPGIHHPNVCFAVKEEHFRSNGQLRCRKVNHWRYLPGVLKTGFPVVLCRIQLIAGNLSGHNLLKAVTFLG